MPIVDEFTALLQRPSLKCRNISSPTSTSTTTTIIPKKRLNRETYRKKTPTTYSSRQKVHDVVRPMTQMLVEERPRTPRVVVERLEDILRSGHVISNSNGTYHVSTKPPTCSLSTDVYVNKVIHYVPLDMCTKSDADNPKYITMRPFQKQVEQNDISMDKICFDDNANRPSIIVKSKETILDIVEAKLLHFYDDNSESGSDSRRPESACTTNKQNKSCLSLIYDGDDQGKSENVNMVFKQPEYEDISDAEEECKDVHSCGNDVNNMPVCISDVEGVKEVSRDGDICGGVVSRRGSAPELIGKTDLMGHSKLKARRCSSFTSNETGLQYNNKLKITRGNKKNDWRITESSVQLPKEVDEPKEPTLDDTVQNLIRRLSFGREDNVTVDDIVSRIVEHEYTDVSMATTSVDVAREEVSATLEQDGACKRSAEGKTLVSESSSTLEQDSACENSVEGNTVVSGSSSTLEQVSASERSTGENTVVSEDSSTLEQVSACELSVEENTVVSEGSSTLEHRSPCERSTEENTVFSEDSSTLEQDSACESNIGRNTVVSEDSNTWEQFSSCERSVEGNTVLGEEDSSTLVQGVALERSAEVIAMVNEGDTSTLIRGSDCELTAEGNALVVDNSSIVIHESDCERNVGATGVLDTDGVITEVQDSVCESSADTITLVDQEVSSALVQGSARELSAEGNTLIINDSSTLVLGSDCERTTNAITEEVRYNEEETVCNRSVLSNEEDLECATRTSITKEVDVTNYSITCSSSNGNNEVGENIEVISDRKENASKENDCVDTSKHIVEKERKANEKISSEKEIPSQQHDLIIGVLDSEKENSSPGSMMNGNSFKTITERVPVIFSKESKQSVSESSCEVRTTNEEKTNVREKDAPLIKDPNEASDEITSYIKERIREIKFPILNKIGDNESVRKVRVDSLKTNNVSPVTALPIKPRKFRVSRRSFRHDSIQTFKPTTAPPPWRYKGRAQILSPDAKLTPLRPPTPELPSVDDDYMESSPSDLTIDMSANDMTADEVSAAEDCAEDGVKNVAEMELLTRSVSTEEQERRKSIQEEISDCSTRSLDSVRDAEDEMIAKKRRKREDNSLMKEVNDRYASTQMKEKGRRLAQELPGFNWLEEKIRNGGVPTVLPKKRKYSTADIVVSPAKVITLPLASPTTDVTSVTVTKVNQILAENYPSHPLPPRRVDSTVSSRRPIAPHTVATAHKDRITVDINTDPRINQLTNSGDLQITVAQHTERIQSNFLHNSMRLRQLAAMRNESENEVSKKRRQTEMQPIAHQHNGERRQNGIPPLEAMPWSFSDRIATMAQHTTTSFDTGLRTSRSHSGPIQYELATMDKQKPTWINSNTTRPTPSPNKTDTQCIRKSGESLPTMNGLDNILQARLLEDRTKVSRESNNSHNVASQEQNVRARPAVPSATAAATAKSSMYTRSAVADYHLLPDVPRGTWTNTGTLRNYLQTPQRQFEPPPPINHLHRQLERDGSRSTDSEHLKQGPPNRTPATSVYQNAQSQNHRPSGFSTSHDLPRMEYKFPSSNLESQNSRNYMESENNMTPPKPQEERYQIAQSHKQWLPSDAERSDRTKLESSVHNQISRRPNHTMESEAMIFKQRQEAMYILRKQRISREENERNKWQPQQIQQPTSHLILQQQQQKLAMMQMRTQSNLPLYRPQISLHHSSRQGEQIPQSQNSHSPVRQLPMEMQSSRWMEQQQQNTRQIQVLNQQQQQQLMEQKQWMYRHHQQQQFHKQQQMQQYHQQQQQEYENVSQQKPDPLHQLVEQEHIEGIARQKATLLDNGTLRSIRRPQLYAVDASEERNWIRRTSSEDQSFGMPRNSPQIEESSTSSQHGETGRNHLKTAMERQYVQQEQLLKENARAVSEIRRMQYYPNRGDEPSLETEPLHNEYGRNLAQNVYQNRVLDMNHAEGPQRVQDNQGKIITNQGSNNTVVIPSSAATIVRDEKTLQGGQTSDGKSDKERTINLHRDNSQLTTQMQKPQTVVKSQLPSPVQRNNIGHTSVPQLEAFPCKDEQLSVNSINSNQCKQNVLYENKKVPKEIISLDRETLEKEENRRKDIMESTLDQSKKICPKENSVNKFVSSADSPELQAQQKPSERNAEENRQQVEKLETLNSQCSPLSLNKKSPQGQENINFKKDTSTVRLVLQDTPQPPSAEKQEKEGEVKQKASGRKETPDNSQSSPKTAHTKSFQDQHQTTVDVLKGQIKPSSIYSPHPTGIKAPHLSPLNLSTSFLTPIHVPVKPPPITNSEELPLDLSVSKRKLTQNHKVPVEPKKLCLDSSQSVKEDYQTVSSTIENINLANTIGCTKITPHVQQAASSNKLQGEPSKSISMSQENADKATCLKEHEGSSLGIGKSKQETESLVMENTRLVPDQNEVKDRILRSAQQNLEIYENGNADKSLNRDSTQVSSNDNYSNSPVKSLYYSGTEDEGLKRLDKKYSSTSNTLPSHATEEDLNRQTLSSTHSLHETPRNHSSPAAEKNEPTVNRHLKYVPVIEHMTGTSSERKTRMAQMKSSKSIVPVSCNEVKNPSISSNSSEYKDETSQPPAKNNNEASKTESRIDTRNEPTVALQVTSVKKSTLATPNNNQAITGTYHVANDEVICGSNQSSPPDRIQSLRLTRTLSREEMLQRSTRNENADNCIVGNKQVTLQRNHEANGGLNQSSSELQTVVDKRNCELIVLDSVQVTKECNANRHGVGNLTSNIQRNNNSSSSFNCPSSTSQQGTGARKMPEDIVHHSPRLAAIHTNFTPTRSVPQRVACSLTRKTPEENLQQTNSSIPMDNSHIIQSQGIRPERNYQLDQGLNQYQVSHPRPSCISSRSSQRFSEENLENATSIFRNENVISRSNQYQTNIPRCTIQSLKNNEHDIAEQYQTRNNYQYNVTKQHGPYYQSVGNQPTIIQNGLGSNNPLISRPRAITQQRANADELVHHNRGTFNVGPNTDLLRSNLMTTQPPKRITLGDAPLLYQTNFREEDRHIMNNQTVYPDRQSSNKPYDPLFGRQHGNPRETVTQVSSQHLHENVIKRQPISRAEEVNIDPNWPLGQEGPSTCCNCSRPARFMCSACRIDRYCSMDCQISKWNDHSKICDQYVRRKDNEVL